MEDNAEHSESDVVLAKHDLTVAVTLLCSQTDVGVDMYPEIANRRYRQHISTGDTYWRGLDLMLSSTRSTPKHFSL